MLLLSTGKRRQRKHFKKLKLHAGKQDRKEEEEEEEEEGREGGKHFQRRLQATGTRSGSRGVERREKFKGKNIYFNYSGVVHFKLS